MSDAGDDEYDGDEYGYGDDEGYGGDDYGEDDYGNAESGAGGSGSPTMSDAPAKELRPVVLGRQMSYELHEPDDTDRMLQEKVKDFSEFLGIEDTPEDAQIALAAGGWDVAGIQSKITESKDDEDVFGDLCKEAGLLNSGPDPPEASRPQVDFMCEICFNEIKPSDSDAAQCGHWACKSCWRTHMESAAGNRGQLLDPRCPFYGCGQRLKMRMLQQYLSAHDLDKLHRWRRENFVSASQGTAKQCPKACGRVAVFPAGTTRDIHCRCGAVWCFKCGELDGHAPATCKMLKDWNSSSLAEQMDAGWLLQHTRKCPHCGMPQESSGGCDHRVCVRKKTKKKKK